METMREISNSNIIHRKQARHYGMMMQYCSPDIRLGSEDEIHERL